ncbi:crossover junction endonuclease MUS81-like isoform X3 [Hordeum vulgare subsp. vulgare]|uniref:crossover junction endonuclease MUS81-like isoform X3 n=1 Tax=Hordeum vulgare subsp. vulgare TaxID=112509 RepID=UPI001D1A49B8|nr:crossover junction endonuclease MUS81-like isoform X3 [Hordeum vulgare subsp. vulgare]
MAPSVPKKKRKVSLPENEEAAARIFEKHRSMAAQQPGGLPDHQARALSAAYAGVCSAKEPVRTPADLARLKGVGDWVVDVMRDSFPGSSLDLSPPTSNTPGDTGKKGKRNKPYVPQLNSAAYAIVITLYREMIRGTEFMKKQELIDAAEASGLSRKAIGPNNYRSKHGNSSSDFYTGWSCMKNLTDKDLVVKKSNPAKYYLTEKGKETARICLAKSGLDDPAGPLMATGHPESVMLSDSDSDEQEGSSPVIGSENFSEMSGLPNSKADNGRATNSPLSSRGMFGQQSFSAMGSAENSLLAMPPRQYDESFLDTYEVVLILDDRDTFGPRARRKVVDNIHTQFDVPVEKCGLRKLIYLVEGDPNTVDGSESVKTACFTTEVLEGFDVQRTTGYADTEKKYGHLTGSIIDYYSRNFSAGAGTSRLCLTYVEFVKRCSDLKKVTVSDIFTLQLMQVPQVTEEAALAVTSLYPTLLSLARAYTMLVSRLFLSTYTMFFSCEAQDHTWNSDQMMAIGAPRRRC